MANRGKRNGIECPECGNVVLYQLGSHAGKDTNGMVSVIRRRECPSCLHRFQTIEIPTELLEIERANVKKTAIELASELVLAALEGIKNG